MNNDNDNSYFVPAKPVWDLVRTRQRQWGYTDEEMAAFLELGKVIDVRGWMSRPMAERLLRRLTRPAAPTPGTLAIHRSMSLMEGASDNRTASQMPEDEAAEAS
jgi:hypothetical protein